MGLDIALDPAGTSGVVQGVVVPGDRCSRTGLVPCDLHA
jgi:hypothetical protein